MRGTPAAASPPETAARRRSRVTLGALAALLVAAAVAVSGTGDGVAAALVVMGFDPDRAQLILGLTMAGLAGAAYGLVAGRGCAAALLGLLALAAFFGATFATETQAALQVSSAGSGLDAGGWGLTLLSLVVLGLAVGGAAGVLAAELRDVLAKGWADLCAVAQARRVRDRRLVRPVGTAGLIVVGLVALTVLAQLIDFSPDVLMRTGALPAMSLTGPTGATPSAPPLDPTPSIAPSLPAAVTAVPTPQSPGYAPGPFPNSTVSAAGWSRARPWLAWGPDPSATSTILHTALAPSFIPGAASRSWVDVYLPPGYAAGMRRYPVTYLPMWDFALWERTTHIREQLDGLIHGGLIPPQIVVFVQLNQVPPYPDSECANSRDGRVAWDTFTAVTVVRWVDSQLRTLALPQDRSLLGFSEGGFCAADLLARHPDVFGLAASTGGYYQAAPASNQTPNAWRVFGGDRRYEARFSPDLLLPRLPAPTLEGLFLVLSAPPSEPFYGQQYTSFATELARLHVPLALLPTSTGHAWQTVRDTIGELMVLLAGRLAATGGLA